MARLRVLLSPWLQPSDEPALRGWCECEVIASRMFAAIDKAQLIGAEKRSAGLIDVWRRLKLVQLQYERELGLTPAARAELGLTVSRMRDPREEIEQRVAALSRKRTS
jgi:hypothetical protein